jgi:hypothetical protein
MMHRFVSPVLLFGLLLLSACSEPTGVGANLGEGRFGEGTPQAFVAVPSTLDTVSAVARTGINAPPPSRPGITTRSWRFLTGIVDDPLTGTVEAEGYVDFLGAAVPDSALQEAVLDSLNVQLRLHPEYRHGDTSSTLRVRLFDLTQEADMDRAPADTPATAFPAEAIESYTVSPSDTLVTFDFEREWISKHQEVLQDTAEFGDDFHGFKLAVENGASVVGFDHDRATLRVFTSTDTVDYTALKSFTRIERRGSPSVSPPNRALLQDGVGSTLLFAWDYTQPLFTDSMSNTRLNKTDVIVPIDTARMRETLSGRPNFVRPSIKGYRVLATRTESTPPCEELGLPALRGDAETCILPPLSGTAPGEVRLPNNASNLIFERVLDGDPLFSSFQVQIADRETAAAQNTVQRGLPTTLPALVRVGSNASEDVLPRANLVVTPY